ncbi:MAG: ribosome biogenesis GTPase Der [Myxococcales bacterium]|nr:ribosome biogenesis GTPase Der [Myxococcales bacterium]
MKGARTPPPLIAIVGRPNVGKSTLFNRLVGGRPALVHDTPGLTRDRRYGELEYFARRIRLVDTGGLDPEAEQDVIGAGIHRQAHAALKECDAVVLVVDARAGITPLDQEVVTMLRKLSLPVVVAANKIDSSKSDELVHELHALGMGDPMPVSAAHGRGVDDLVQAVVDLLAIEPNMGDEGEGEESEEAALERPLRIAFVGKPNAGKSSLVNRLLGVERSLVHDVPGTTTDPVDTDFEFGGTTYTLVDTAGIRRRGRIDEETERISVSLAIAQLRRADVVVLVIDGNEEPSEQDARLAGMIEDSGKGLIIALNKSDLLGGQGAFTKLREKTEDELHFLSFAPMHLISALRGDGVSELMKLADKVAVESRKRIATSELNRFFAEVCQTHPPPNKGARMVTIHYLTQARVSPPTFLLFANHPTAVDKSYNRFIANQLRARYGFEGTPLRVYVKPKSQGRNRKSGAKKGVDKKGRGPKAAPGPKRGQRNQRRKRR